MLLMEAPYFKNHCDIVRRRQWHPTPVLLPGKSHGQRSLVGCCPWGSEESDTTERLHFHVSLSCIGEGNGNPLQGSCPENPRDRGAWWAAICGVAQTRTWLKWLSSSSGQCEREKAMAPHSSTLAWKIPWAEEPGGLQSMGSLSRTRLSNFTFTFHFPALEKAMAPHSSVLAWRIPGTGEPGGLPSMGSHSVRHDWSDLAAAAAAVSSLSPLFECKFHIGSRSLSVVFTDYITVRHLHGLTGMSSLPRACW